MKPVILAFITILAHHFTFGQDHSTISKAENFSFRKANISNTIEVIKSPIVTSSISEITTFKIRSNPYEAMVNPNETRVALVIGNSNYQNSSKLKNPENDARDMSSTLKKIGFDVMEVTNADYLSMRNALKIFESKITKVDIVLCYYAGHGIQVDGKNYLIPIDAQLAEKSHIKYETINVEMIAGIMELAANKNRLNMVILDACRNNPFRTWSRGGNDGLVKIDPPNGTLIAYATSPNSVASDGNGKNGLYTGELIKQLLISQRIEDVFINTRVAVEEVSNFQQSPWEQAKLRGAYYLLKEQ